MGFFKKLFGKELGSVSAALSTTTVEPQVENSPSWLNIGKFVPSDDHAKNRIISIITTAIAAGENSSSRLKVKRIQQLNPEFKLVTLIATSIAAGDAPDKKFIVKSVQRKID
ncbi:hypothetical protein ACLUXD_06785 [Loigolactobacillus coryniformis subsp. coryniformis]|uniref:hypothetical protein n=1 Tax=Loigolactobacillus coryniformis TaxID=1610 RepID=UPI00021936EB|nr:hypothetical protein [Loigolactobacillus coryniformis]ATO54581.1 hypothetical protein LC20001_02555 [Loigolactobacillus coryniformis subsp. coryniformis KCTC 3167 = DSM 20001]MDT3393496.1 hypothetical protein [Bacillota bacterium]